LYGDYLERCLLKAQASAAKGVRLQMIEGEVLRLQPRAGGEGPALFLGEGATLESTEVVLALGNFTPPPMRPAAPPRPSRRQAPCPARGAAAAAARAATAS